MTRKICWFTIGVIVLCVIQGILVSDIPAQDPSQDLLVVATDYPPYEFETPDGELRGFDVEVVEEAFKRVGISVTFEFYPWARAVQMTKEGKAAAALTCARGPEREEFILFSEPISFMTDILLVRKEYDGEPVTTLKDLHRMKLDIGIIRGEILSAYLDEKEIPYDESPSFEVALKKLADGRIDAVPLILEYTQYNIHKLGMQDEFKWFLRTDVNTDAFHLCFSKKLPDVENVAEAFNTGLQAIRDDGSYEAIHARYR